MPLKKSIDSSPSPPSPPQELRTERLCLRSLDERDAPAVFEYASNPNVTRYTLFETHSTIDDALAFVGEYARGSYLEGVPAPLGVILKETGALIGTIGCRWASVQWTTRVAAPWL